MSTRRRVILIYFLAALALTLAGLARWTLLHRSVVVPGYPEALSNFVEARGFPLAWRVTGPPEITAPLAWWRKVLWVRLGVSWLCNLGLIWAVKSVVFGVGRSLLRRRGA